MVYQTSVRTEAGDLSVVLGLASAATLALLKDLMEDAEIVLELGPLKDCWTRFTAGFQIPRSFDTIQNKTSKID